MKIPKSIMIMGRKWIVITTSKDIAEGGDFELMGICLKEKRAIVINEASLKDSGSTIEEVFLHELFHALCWECGFGQTSISKDIEEILCEQFARFFDSNYRLTPRKHK